MHESLLPEHILFEDHHLLVINKPAPLLTQAPPAVPSLEAMAKAYIKAKHNKPAGVYLGIPHRLDRPVSGVVCLRGTPRPPSAFTRSSRNIASARCTGRWSRARFRPTPRPGRTGCAKLAAESRVERAAEGEPAAKLALLGYRVLQRLAGATLLELSPLTGRMHQLRVQAAWRGHAVLGDSTYGSARAFGPAAELPRDRVIALHCVQPDSDPPLHEGGADLGGAGAGILGRSDSLPLIPVDAAIPGRAAARRRCRSCRRR